VDFKGLLALAGKIAIDRPMTIVPCGDFIEKTDHRSSREARTHQST
jgi:hypothetical protein